MKEDEFNKVKERILEIIKNSNVPEDPLHAENTLKWLLVLCPKADDAMKIAALGHDIERAIEDKKIKRKDFDDFDEFKRAHAQNSAKILRDILKGMGLSDSFVEDVAHLVELHEFGGDPRADCIKEADSISFFDTNLPLFFEREGIENAKKRAIWGYNRLSSRGKKIVKGFKYKNRLLQELIENL